MPAYLRLPGYLYLLVLCIFFALPLHAEEAAAILSGKVRLTVKETLLVLVPEPELLVPESLAKNVFLPSIFVSPDGKRLAYRIQRDGQWRMTVDSKEEGAYDLVDEPVFSADCRHIAYIAHQGEKVFVVLDGKAGKKWDEISPRPIFSPDGQRMAYVAYNGNKGTLFVNEREVASDDAIGNPVFSPDNKRLAYTIYHNNKVYHVVDNKRQEAYEPLEGCADMNPVFSPDSRHVAYPGWRNKRWFIVWDGKEGSSFSNIYNPVFSPDSSHIAYHAEQGERQCIVVDNKPGPLYDVVDLDPIFSPDSKHVAYAAMRGEQHFLVVDGKESSPAYSRVRGPFYSPDGRYLAFRASDENGEFLCVNQEKGTPFRVIGSPVFSSDSRFIAHYGERAENSYCVVVNNVRGKEAYNNILTRPTFIAPNKLLFFGVRWRDTPDDKGESKRENQVIQVEVTMEPTE